MKCENYFDPFYLQLYFTILNTGLAAFKFREKTQRKKIHWKKLLIDKIEPELFTPLNKLICDFPISAQLVQILEGYFLRPH
jgi:hypothetical protein